MNTTPHELIKLHERIEKIEMQNRRLKKSLIGVFCCLLALGLMGAKVGLKDGRFRQITVESISVINPAGQEIMTLGYHKDQGTGLRVYNKSGERVLGLGITADERGSGILIADKNGAPRLGLGMDQGLPSLAMADENGKKFLALGGDSDGYGLVIMDDNETERAGVGYKDGSTGIVIYDTAGQYVRGMIHKADGNHFSSYIDTDGKEIYSK